MTNHDQEEAMLVRFFPGLRANEVLQVGRVLFWNFPAQIDDYLPNWAQDRARRFAAFYKDNHGVPLAEFVCATVQEAAETEELDVLNQEILYAADILCYAEQAPLFPGERSIRIDHFESHYSVISQAPANDVVAFDGLDHRTIVGLGANFDYYLPPLMRRVAFSVPPNEPLLQALGISLERWRQAEAGDLQESEITEDRRLLRAIGWYNQSGFRFSRHTFETLILHAATALEALLDLPRGSTTEGFRNAVALLLGDNAELRRWCNDFYNVRSRIIHGDETPALMYGASGQRPHLSHLDFSRKIFEQCLISLLVNRCHLPYDPLVIKGIRAMNIDSRLVSNQQRMQEIAEIEPVQALSDPDITNRLRGSLFHIDYYETNSVTQEVCDGAIEKVCEIIILMCERIAAGSDDDGVREISTSLRELIEEKNFIALGQIRRANHERGGHLNVSDLPLWKVVDGLKYIVDIRKALSRRSSA